MALLQSLGKLLQGAGHDVVQGAETLASPATVALKILAANQNTSNQQPQLPNALGNLLYSGSHAPAPTYAVPNIHPGFHFAPNFQGPGQTSFHFVGGQPGAINSQAFVNNPRGLNVMGDAHGNLWQEDVAGNKYPYAPIKNAFTSPASPAIRPIDGPTIQNTPFYRTVDARPQMQAGGPVPLANLPRITI